MEQTIQTPKPQLTKEQIEAIKKAKEEEIKSKKIITK